MKSDKLIDAACIATHQERNESTHQEKNKTWSSRKKQDPRVKS